MTHNIREVEELAKELRMVANMINMGEKIQWARETTLMDRAADMLEALHHQELQKAREEERKKVLWNIGAMIEEADFARKVTERTGEALPTLEVQAVIKQVQIMLDRYHSELDQPIS